MASLLTHLGVGAVAGRLAFGGQPRRLVWLAAFLSAAPDLDVVSFALGIPYEHALGHRGLSHSLFVAALAGLVAALAVGARPLGRAAVALGAVTASHGLLDALTNGGLGVALFAPFDDGRYFFPVRPIRVSPIGVGEFLSHRGVEVLVSEIVWVWVPVGFVVGVGAIVRRWRRGQSGAAR